MTLDELITAKEQTNRPTIVTHSGSTARCKKRFAEMRLKDTIANRIVLTVGCDTHSDADLSAMGTRIDKTGLDVLHLHKIDLSDELLVLDVTDDERWYIGPSTWLELQYARKAGKRIRFYSQERSGE